MRVVLASSSPSRLAILRSAGIEPVVHPTKVDEQAIIDHMAGADPSQIVQALARAKGEAVEGFDEDLVLAADSMLLVDGQLQGKPLTGEETIRRWRKQRGKSAELLSGHYIRTPKGVSVATARAVLHFAEASDADIEAYAATGEPWQCAGAFTLEALGGWFIDRIEGDPSTVIGLSLPLVRQALYADGISVSELWNIP